MQIDVFAYFKKIINRLNTMNNKNKENTYLKMVIFILPFLIYVSTIVFPYLLADDLWLIRNSPNSPSLLFIAIGQGRPFFSLIVLLTRIITGNTDQTHLLFFAISILRIIAIFCISIFGIIMFKWLKKWGWSSLTAIICVALFVSLPSMQLYVANGQWVALGMLSAGLSIYFLDRYFLATSQNQRRVVFIFILMSLLFSWGTYQITPFFMLALLLAPLLNITKKMIWPLSSFNSLSSQLQMVMIGFSCFFISMVLYVGIWFFVKHFFPDFENGDKRYGLTLSNLRTNFISILHYFFTMRLPQMLNL